MTVTTETLFKSRSRSGFAETLIE